MDISLNQMILKKINKIQDQLSTNNQDDWMCMKEVIKYAKISDSTIRRAITNRNLKVSKKTGKNLFRKEWVDNFLGK